MTHGEMDELYELYAMGVLEAEPAAEISQHLEDGCSYCGEHVMEAAKTTAGFSALAETVEPPKRLRERVLASVAPPKSRRTWTFAIAGLSAACAALLVFSVWATADLHRMRDELAGLRNERDQLRSAVEILSKPETRTVEFGRTENVPHGRVLLNRQGGLVFAGSHLPPLPSNKTFELWLIPAAKGGAPQAAGLFRPNASGDFVDVSRAPVDASQIAAVAVSVEPLEGSTAPTTKLILIVPLG